MTTHDAGVPNALPGEESNDWDTGGGYGNWLSINHGIVNGKSVSTHYAHLSTVFLVHNGDHVKRGQPIAYSGHNGYSTQPHFHLTTVVNGVYVDPYNESSASVDQYPDEEDNYLWTSNPPTHGYYNNVYYTFLSGSSEGMTSNSHMTEVEIPGSDYFNVEVSNTGDPAVDSPEYSAGLKAKYITIDFSARVLDGGDPVLEGKVYIKDASGSWVNHVPLELVNDEYDHNGGYFAVNDFNMYRASLVNVSNNNVDMRQFSIQMTDGFTTQETWTFDWIKLKISSWDFSDNSIGWEIRQDGITADYFAGNYWRISPTEKQPQITSPDNLFINDSYTMIQIDYSIQNTNSETLRAYFDVGSGFSTNCYTETSVVHNGNTVHTTLDLPACAVGKTKKALFDLMDNTSFENKLIALDKISFLSQSQSSPNTPNIWVESFGDGVVAGYQQKLIVAFDESSLDPNVASYKVDVYSSTTLMNLGVDGDLIADERINVGANFCRVIDATNHPVVFIKAVALSSSDVVGTSITGYKLIGNIIGTHNDGVSAAAAVNNTADLNAFRVYYRQPTGEDVSSYCQMPNLYQHLSSAYTSSPWKRADYDADGSIGRADYYFYSRIDGNSGAGY